MKLSSLALDVARIEAGEWVDNIPDAGDLRIKTRGITNADFRKLFDAKMTALPRRDRRSLPPDVFNRIQAECLVETCLLDWENLEGVPFSKETALRLLLDPRYEPLRLACAWAATTVSDLQAEDREDDAKN